MSGWDITKPRGRVALSPGDHACCIYSTNAELVDIVSDFVAEGLGLGERCWYVAASNDDGAVVAALQCRGVQVVNETRRGAFALIPANEAYPVQDTFEPERSMRVFSDAIEQALRDGFTGFRAVAEMSWALKPGGTERLIEYEALLRTLFASARVTGLCLYPRVSTPAEALLGVLATHPLAATRGPIAVNPFYEPDVQSIRPVKKVRVAGRLKRLDARASDTRA